MPAYDEYKIITFEDTINVSMQNVVSNYFDYTKKWNHLKNDSVLEWMEKNIQTNTDMIFKPTDQISIPDYFKANGSY